MKCLECQKELVQTQGKRSKQFCNSTCRSNFWQKANRKKNASVASNKPQGDAEIKNLNKPSQVKSLSEKPPESNYSINTSKRAYNPFDNPRFNTKNK